MPSDVYDRETVQVDRKRQRNPRVDTLSLHPTSTRRAGLCSPTPPILGRRDFIRNSQLVTWRVHNSSFSGRPNQCDTWTEIRVEAVKSDECYAIILRGIGHRGLTLVSSLQTAFGAPNRVSDH